MSMLSVHAGVKLKDGTVLAADLVVDASGPRGKTRQWLEEGGYPVQDVRTVEVDPHVGYTMEVLDVPDEARGNHTHAFDSGLELLISVLTHTHIPEHDHHTA